MLRMVVTLEVSKFSGWLNTDAYCRGSKGGHTHSAARGRRRAAAAHSQRAGEGSTADMGAGHGEERT